MAAWELIPSLVTLRAEFNAVNPARDKGADGSIGDSAHTSASDHTPDEDSDVLRDHDADSKNEVHALDIDSSGPWPSAGWFAVTIEALRLEERRRWLDPNDKCRLKYIIWDRRIASQSSNFEWRDYAGSDPHTNHAHFSGRYETVCENDTRPWGVYQEDDMPTVAEIWQTDGIIAAPEGANAEANPFWAPGSFLRDSSALLRKVFAQNAAILLKLGEDNVDEAEVARLVLAGMSPAAIADLVLAGLPSDLAAATADEIARRLANRGTVA